MLIASLLLVVILLALILAVLLVGAQAVLGMLRWFVLGIAVLLCLIGVALFFEKLFPFIAAGVGIFAMAMLIAVGRSAAEERTQRLIAKAAKAKPTSETLRRDAATKAQESGAAAKAMTLLASDGPLSEKDTFFLQQYRYRLLKERGELGDEANSRRETEIEQQLEALERRLYPDQART